jgi:hypothetical protein
MSTKNLSHVRVCFRRIFVYHVLGFGVFLSEMGVHKHHKKPFTKKSSPEVFTKNQQKNPTFSFVFLRVSPPDLFLSRFWAFLRARGPRKQQQILFFTGLDWPG